MFYPFITTVDFVSQHFFSYCLFEKKKKKISNSKTYTALKMPELTQIMKLSLGPLYELIILFCRQCKLNSFHMDTSYVISLGKP